MTAALSTAADRFATFTDAYLPADPTAAYLELFVTPDESPSGEYGFFCNHCGYECVDGPCLEHAPLNVPGLRLVECQAEPRHYIYSHDRDDYGHGCPACYVVHLLDRLAVLERCRHRPWRRWRITRWVVRWLPVTGYGYDQGYNGCKGCLITKPMRWRWSR